MDNYFQNCPPMMEDQGRHLADFKSATRRNEYIKYINDVWRDDQYRLFLQKNGRKFLDRDFAYNKKYNSCWENECVHNYPTRQTTRQFVQERQAYDSIYDLKTREKLANMRKCIKYDDFRLNPQN